MNNTKKIVKALHKFRRMCEQYRTGQELEILASYAALLIIRINKSENDEDHKQGMIAHLTRSLHNVDGDSDQLVRHLSKKSNLTRLTITS